MMAIGVGPIMRRRPARPVRHPAIEPAKTWIGAAPVRTGAEEMGGDRPRRGSDRHSGGRSGRNGTRFHREERERFPMERPRLAPYPERPRPSVAELFRTQKPLIGVVHLKPLPGSPGYDGLFLDLLDAALSDARAIEAGGAAGMLVENYGDAPFYPDVVPPETVAAMTRLVTEIRKVVRIPVGVNVLRNDARAGVAVAAATGAGFVRVNVHIGVIVTDQGSLSGRAWESVRLRETLRSRTLLFADLRVKHGVPLVEFDLLAEVKDTVQRGRADALILTGQATGMPADLDQMRAIKKAFPNVSLLVGSGVDSASIQEVLEVADGCIVGTAIKRDGRLENPVEIDRVRALADVAERLSPRVHAERGAPRPAFGERPVPEPVAPERVYGERAPADRTPAAPIEGVEEYRPPGTRGEDRSTMPSYGEPAGQGAREPAPPAADTWAAPEAPPHREPHHQRETHPAHHEAPHATGEPATGAPAEADSDDGPT